MEAPKSSPPRPPRPGSGHIMMQWCGWYIILWEPVRVINLFTRPSSIFKSASFGTLNHFISKPTHPLGSCKYPYRIQGLLLGNAPCKPVQICVAWSSTKLKKKAPTRFSAFPTTSWSFIHLHGWHCRYEELASSRGTVLIWWLATIFWSLKIAPEHWDCMRRMHLFSSCYLHHALCSAKCKT